MAARHEDWMKQAKRDLQHARNSLQMEDYEWRCFAAQQSAEKAVKALFQRIVTSLQVNSVTMLLNKLPESIKPPTELVDKAKDLDKHYITSRYPDSWPQGAPFQYLTEQQARRSIQYASEIISFCDGIPGGQRGI